MIASASANMAATPGATAGDLARHVQRLAALAGEEECDLAWRRAAAAEDALRHRAASRPPACQEPVPSAPSPAAPPAPARSAKSMTMRSRARITAAIGQFAGGVQPLATFCSVSSTLAVKAAASSAPSARMPWSGADAGRRVRVAKRLRLTKRRAGIRADDGACRATPAGRPVLAGSVDARMQPMAVARRAFPARAPRSPGGNSCRRSRRR